MCWKYGPGSLCTSIADGSIIKAKRAYDLDWKARSELSVPLGCRSIGAAYIESVVR